MSVTTPRTGTFSEGAGYVLKGLKLLTKPGIRSYALMPLAVNVLVFGAGFVLVGWTIEYAMDHWLPGWLDWLRWLLWPVVSLCAFAIVFFGFSVLANLVGGPFNGLLAAAVERHLAGTLEDTPFSWSSVPRELFAAIVAELRKAGYVLARAIPCLVLFVIPGINVVAAPAWLLFGAWMLAIEYIDCPLGNHGRPFPEVRHRLRPHRRLALGFGTAILGMTVVPGLNLIAMPAGVAGATALYLERLRLPTDDFGPADTRSPDARTA